MLHIQTCSVTFKIPLFLENVLERQAEELLVVLRVVELNVFWKYGRQFWNTLEKIIIHHWTKVNNIAS